MSIFNFKIKAKDFSDYKFHCSSLGSLVGSYVSYITGNPLSEKQQETFDKLTKKPKLTAKQKETLQSLEDKIVKHSSGQVELTQGAKTMLVDIFNKECLGINPFSDNKDTARGTRDEQRSLDLFNQVYKTDYKKNTKEYENDYIIGTPDIIGKGVLDIKTAKNWKTFSRYTQSNADEHKWQLWGYERLLEGLLTSNQSYIIRALPSYPDDVIIKETQAKLKYLEDQTEEKVKAIKRRVFLNMNFDRFKPADLIKVFSVETPTVDSRIVYQYLDVARSYLNGITKNYFKI